MPGSMVRSMPGPFGGGVCADADTPATARIVINVPAMTFFMRSAGTPRLPATTALLFIVCSCRPADRAVEGMLAVAGDSAMRMR